MALKAKEVSRLFQVPTHSRVRLRDHGPGWAVEKHFKDLTKDELNASEYQDAFETCCSTRARRGRLGSVA